MKESNGAILDVNSFSESHAPTNSATSPIKTNIKRFMFQTIKPMLKVIFIWMDIKSTFELLFIESTAKGKSLIFNFSFITRLFTSTTS